MRRTRPRRNAGKLTASGPHARAETVHPPGNGRSHGPEVHEPREDPETKNYPPETHDPEAKSQQPAPSAGRPEASPDQ